MGIGRLYQKIGLLLVLYLGMEKVVFAAAGGPPPKSFEDFLRLIYNLTLPGAIIAGFFFIAIAGYTLMTGQGNPDQVKKGKENLSSAIMGLIFILLSLGILRVVISTLISPSPGF